MIYKNIFIKQVGDKYFIGFEKENGELVYLKEMKESKYAKYYK